MPSPGEKSLDATHLGDIKSHALFASAVNLC